MENRAEIASIEVIRRQLEAYNRHDALEFAACYAPEADILDLHTGETILSGRDSIQARFSKRFEQAGLRVEIVGRMLLPGLVVDSERIFTDASPEPGAALVMYEVREGLIRRSWVYRILEG